MHLGIDFIQVMQEKYVSKLGSDLSYTNSKKGAHILLGHVVCK